MDHSKFRELLSAYADGELAPAQRETVELHLSECPDCQQALAEFRLVGKRLTLLADPIINAWYPDVTTRVNARIQRRRYGWALGRRMAAWAAGALAVVIVIVSVHLLRRSPDVLPTDDKAVAVPLQVTTQPTRQPDAPTARPPRPTQHPPPTTLESPSGQVMLYLLDAETLVESPTDGAIRNLGYRLTTGASGGFVVVEIVGGEQMLLDSADAPSIYVPANIQPGDRVRLFAVTHDGETTPAAEFTTAIVDGTWRALDVHQIDTAPELQIQLPTPTPFFADQWPPTPFPPVTPAPEVVLQIEELVITPDPPRQGQPFTVTAVIRNASSVNAHAPIWFGAFEQKNPYPIATSRTAYVYIPADKAITLTWHGEDQWERVGDVSREHAHLIFRVGVNILRPGGLRPWMLPEADKSDNEAQITVDFLPYKALVSDACPPGDNLWLELDSGRDYQVPSRESALRLAVHNDGHTEVVRVPLRITDASGDQYLIYARWVPPCGGSATVEEASISAEQLTYPITLTLNPIDAADAVPENDRDDNTLVVGEYAACTGDTDLWIADDDVTVDGDDLLVTVHLAGATPERSSSLHIYHTADGRLLASEEISQITCKEPLTLRFEGILSGLSGGYVMVQIDTEANRVEPVYPQHNNSAMVPLP